MTRTLKPLFSVQLLCAICALSLGFNANAQSTLKLDYRVLEVSSHDSATFTQGLALHNNIFYESSGLYGKSFVRSYNSKDNSALAEWPLPAQIFAEGLTLLDNSLFLLSWKAGVLMELDAISLTPIKQTRYKGEGWGLTNDGQSFIMSDGGNRLYFRNANSFAIERSVRVHSKWKSYSQLNELEYADKYIWANVWQSPYILKVSPATGEVMGIVDFSDLVKKNSGSDDSGVLNGIAYDAANDAFWITGKFWQNRYLVKITAAVP
ncbi:MAG: glutamine cyclotransferase [Lentisphaeria bacterium]|jgi:glutamine cyclotransferase